MGMTKLASQMTPWDYEQFGLTEQVNPNGWVITKTEIIDDTVFIGVCYESNGWLAPFDVIELYYTNEWDGLVAIDGELQPGTKDWAELWRRIITYLDNENERRAMS